MMASMAFSFRSAAARSTFSFSARLALRRAEFNLSLVSERSVSFVFRLVRWTWTTPHQTATTAISVTRTVPMTRLRFSLESLVMAEYSLAINTLDGEQPERLVHIERIDLPSQPTF